MDKGGNNNWKTFFDEHVVTKLEGRTFDECTIGDRYSGDVGEEWRERLTAKVEGKAFVPTPKEVPASVSSMGTSAADSRSTTSVGRDQKGKGMAGSPLRSSSPTLSIGASAGSSRKAQNETYFAKLGGENASRPPNLPPSQGGKYAGFGSEPPPIAGNTDQKGALPGVEEFQKDPVAALTKGFGWFTTTVGKSAKTVNESYIQPTAQKVYLPNCLNTSMSLHLTQVAASGSRPRKSSPSESRSSSTEYPVRYQDRLRFFQPLRGWGSTSRLHQIP